MTNQIKAIFFDLDGTLRHSVPDSSEIFINFIVRLGLDVTHEDRMRSARWEYEYWANSPDLRDDIVAHSMDTDNFWIEYSRKRLIALGATEEWAAQNAPASSAHMGEMYKPDSIVPPDVQRALPKLRDAGYRMAVISNRDDPFHELLVSHHISEFFEFSLAAGEVKIFKPDPGVFLHALEQANLQPGETVYVGDNYYADVVGARNAGLIPVLYDPDDIFPEADCIVIRSFDELQSSIESI